jgi:hypothetical protein
MLLPTGSEPLILHVPWKAIQRSFDTAKECEDARAKATPPAPGKTPEAFFCVATDDPRLQVDLH